MASQSISQFTPLDNNASEPFDPWALRPDLTDRELLATFVETLEPYGFLDMIHDGIDALWDSDDHPDMYAHLHILREALRLAAARTDAGREGEGGAE